MARKCKVNFLLIMISDHFFPLFLQIVTCVPTKSLPKNICSWGHGEEEEEIIPDVVDTAMPTEVGRRGQILWVRGLTRLQQQVCLLCDSSDLPVISLVLQLNCQLITANFTVTQVFGVFSKREIICKMHVVFFL